MPNEYYTEQFGGQSFGLAKVENVEASFKRVEAGFEKLPDPRALYENRVAAVVATGGPVNYTVIMNPAPTTYTDGMAIQVRFPLVNEDNPTLDILDPDGVTLGAKPIRQVNGFPLLAGHVTIHARAELYFVDQDNGYWILGAGARGATGPAGPPAGRFSLNADKELIFTPDDGSETTNLGPVAPVYQGVYAAGTTYKFLHVVRIGTRLYLHVGTQDTTGVGVSDTTVWQLWNDLSHGDGISMEFRSATGSGDPGNGRMRFNNATLANVTRIVLDEQDADGNDVAAFIDTWDDYGSSDDRGFVLIKGTEGNTETLVFKITGASDDRSGYKRLNVEYISGGSRPGNGDIVTVTPLLRGRDTSTEIATLTDAATIQWDVSENPVAKVTLRGNRSLQINNAREGESYYLWARQDSTGGRRLALPGSSDLDVGALTGEIDQDRNQITLLAFLMVFGKLRLVAQRTDYSG